MDEGTFVAAGVPSFGFTGTCGSEFLDECYTTWHDPSDTTEAQSAVSLGQAGRATEALIRQLLLTDDFPRQSGPYLYFEGSAASLRGLPLTLIFLLPVALFLASAFLIDRRSLGEKAQAWRSALPHYLSLWLPLTISVALLYGMVEVGLLERFAYYFATTKDPAWTQPRWPAIGTWFLALVAMIALGRRLAARAGGAMTPSHPAIHSLAFLAIGLAAVFVVLTNPFSLIFMLPLFFWLLIRGRRWPAFLLDLAFFLYAFVLTGGEPHRAVHPLVPDDDVCHSHDPPGSRRGDRCHPGCRPVARRPAAAVPRLCGKVTTRIRFDFEGTAMVSGGSRLCRPATDCMRRLWTRPAGGALRWTN
jgi:hypothetical protein